MTRFHVHAHVTDLALLEEGQTTCCDARSDKHWVTGPQGVAWADFQSLENTPLFREAAPAPGAACGAPSAAPAPEAAARCC